MSRLTCRISIIALMLAAGPVFFSHAQGASCPEGYVELRREMTADRKLRLYCQPIDSSTVDLSRSSLAEADKSLMKHQWEMSVDWRYRNEPVVQQYIRNLWNAVFSGDDAKAVEANDKLERILADQLKANGLSPQKIAAFFAKVRTFYTGEGPTPKEWGKASQFARELDAATGSSGQPSRLFYDQLERSPGEVRSIKADISPMFSVPQTVDDCVLHAIANGAQVSLKQVKAKFRTTLKNLGMDRIEERSNPELAVADPKHGGRGGLNPYEEILIAEQVGKVIAVPKGSFAKAIESTGRPVVTTVIIDEQGGSHEVVVTGVHRAEDGKIYYSVMDSNLKNHDDFTAYVEKSGFERHMPSGGYVVVPVKKR